MSKNADQEFREVAEQVQAELQQFPQRSIAALEKLRLRRGVANPGPSI